MALAFSFALLFLVAVSVVIVLRSSLPILQGEIEVKGISNSVVIERDNLGIPKIAGSSRADVAFGTGFVHAQDRFFQMDLLRREAAGELAEVFGQKALGRDKANRIHRFRSRAEAILSNLSDDETAVLEAYARGVNAGLGKLRSRPWEYWLFREKPREWVPEDSVLVIFAMYLSLKDSNGKPDILRGVMKETLPDDVFNFMLFNEGNLNAALDSSVLDTPPFPDAAAFDYLSSFGSTGAGNKEEVTWPSYGGSNQWAVSSERTADARAIIANDMHLPLEVPNIWYRASFTYQMDGDPVSAVGATIPGLPLMVIGSNHHVAWGFTNLYTDATDVIRVQSSGENHYMNGESAEPFESLTEEIAIKGKQSVRFPIKATKWGPVVGESGGQDSVALKWIAHERESINFKLLEFESALSVEEVLRLAAEVRMPAVNLMVADSRGAIAWTAMGALPDRDREDGHIPFDSTDETISWEKQLNEKPVIDASTHEMLWTANNRVLGREWLKEIGALGHDAGFRAKRIKEVLTSYEVLDEKDMLDIQLNDTAASLLRWRDLMASVLSAASESNPTYKEVLSEIEQWDGRASADSAAYFWVKYFRENLAQRVFRRVLAPCYERSEDFDFRIINFEAPLWEIVTRQPKYLQDETLGSWQAEFLVSIEDTLSYGKKKFGDRASVKSMKWGQLNRLQMHHPFSRMISPLRKILSMPSTAMDGDKNVIRVASPGFGASQRMVVSPGKEEDGIFHMPGGQSGHFLSPHYDDSHEAWLDGRASAFLPGETVSTLVLIPSE